MAKLLLIDDDTEVLSINKKYFMKEHYEVKTADSAEKGLKLLSTFEADCILLDIMMPGMDGFEACKRIRKISKAPISILSGKTSEDDKINGLLLGADDYMIKPYSLRELSARIQVQIRRHAASEVASATVLSFPPLKIDIAMHKAYYDTEEILLSNREYELLYLLASRPNTPVTFEEIGVAVFGSYVESDRRTIMVTASRLRKKLESYTGLSNYIETVWSKGYLFRVKEK